jgi:hypothetical protein
MIGNIEMDNYICQKYYNLVFIEIYRDDPCITIKQ